MVQSGPSNSIVEESYDQNQFSGVLGLIQQIPLKVGWPKPTRERLGLNAIGFLQKLKARSVPLIERISLRARAIPRAAGSAAVVSGRAPQAFALVLVTPLSVSLPEDGLLASLVILNTR